MPAHYSDASKRQRWIDRVFRVIGLTGAAWSLFAGIALAQATGVVIPHTAWQLKYVDSQETVGENGAATNAFDGSTGTFWHTQWYGTVAPLPHEIQINLGGMYNVSGFRYLPRQDGITNGRIAQYEFYVSLDGVNWGTPVKTGTLANVATEQEVLFTAKTGQYVRLRALSEVNGLQYTSMAELNVLSSGDRPPNGTIGAPAGDVAIAPGQSVSFSGSGTDPENDVPLTYRWNFGTGGPASSTSQNPGAVIFPNAGVYAVTFTVTDSLGNADPTPDTRTITVSANAGAAIPHTGWQLKYVDSQETVGENGAATNAFDGNTGTFWHTQWYGGVAPLPHEIQINLAGVFNVSGFRYLPRQDGITNGRIAQYEFYVSLDGVNWGTPVKTGTLANVATEQTVLFTAKQGQYVRLRALSEVNGLQYTSMAELNVLASGDRPPDGTIGAPAGDVTIAPGQSVSFSGSGTDPENDVPLTYRWNFGTGGPASSTAQNPGAVTFPTAGVYTVTFTVTDSLGNADPTPATRTITVSANAGAAISQAGWQLKYVDSQETVGENGLATNAFDGNTGTFWHTQWYGTVAPLPHEIQINLGGVYNVSGFRYLPRQDGITNGRMAQYEFYVSLDGVNWGTPVKTGTLANVATEQTVLFTAKQGQYVRLRALSEVNGLQYTSMAELNVLASGDRPPDGVIQTPTSDVTVAPGGSVSFSGSGTDPENEPLTYLWNFGTGGPPSSTAQNPGAVIFPNAGVYTVTFTVTDSMGNPDPTPAKRTITVQAGAGSASLISQAGWTLRYVDSQNLSGENDAATNAFDGNPNTYWHVLWYNSSGTPLPHEIQIDLGATYQVAGFRYLPRQNQQSGHIGDYEFYVSLDGTSWGTAVATGSFPDTNSLAEREVLFTPKSGRYVRLRALSEANGFTWTAVAELNVLKAGTTSNQAPVATISAPAQNVTIVAGSALRLAGSGSDPDGNLPLTYRWSVTPGSGLADSTVQNPGLVHFDKPGTFTVTLTVGDALGSATTTTRTVTVVTGTAIPKTAWSLRYVDSQGIDSGNPAIYAFDGNTTTFWHTEWQTSQPPPPHEIQIDLGASYPISGFRYLPRQDGSLNGNIGAYRFYVSTDGVNWGSPVAIGTFANSAAQKEVASTLKTGRYVRLRALTEANGLPYTSMAELDVLQRTCAAPSVRLIAPRSLYIQSSSTLSVRPDVCPNAAGQGVRLMVDGGTANGGTQVDLYTAPYSATITGLSKADHVVEAFLIDANGNPVSGTATYDQSARVGIGDSYFAIGDGGTFLADDVPTDDNSQDGRNMLGGYTSILSDVLTSRKGYPVSIADEAVPATGSSDGAASMALLLEKYPNTQGVFVDYGHNDYLIYNRPSGLGLHPGDAGYPGSFKDYIQQIINAAKAAGKVTFLAKAPGALPFGSPTDLAIVDYDRVIDELAQDPNNAIPVAPADFYTYFYGHTNEYSADGTVPNGTGYQSESRIWQQELAP